MKTCKDCIHENICVIKAYPDAFENTQWDNEPCDHFKDKSLILNLPCKVGDTVYEIVNNEIKEVKVVGITCFISHADSCAVIRTDMTIHTRCHKGVVTAFDLSDFSDILFPTKESAEQALKEREHI